MRAAQPLSGHFLPKKYIGKRTLRQCATSAKGDNIVLIEVDSDDCGDVIILDVPESLQEKFRKNQEHYVISIDDDDDGSESRAGKCDMADDATTSNGFSSAVHPSNCANEGGVFVGEGSKPVKLSKSKRTYSGKSICRNRYGLGPDSESCSSESDDSDCELMEDSFGKFREEWEKASFRRRHDRSVHSDAEDKAGPSVANLPVHHSAEKGTAGHLKPTSNQNNLGSPNYDSNSQKSAKETDGRFTSKHGHYRSSSDFENNAGTSESDQPFQDSSGPSTAEKGIAEHLKSTSNQNNLGSPNHDSDSRQDSVAKEMGGLFKRKHGHYHRSSDLENNAGSSESGQPFQHSSGPSTPEHSELPRANGCFEGSLNHEGNGIFSAFAEWLAEQSKSSHQDSEAEGAAKISTGNRSDDVIEGTTNQDVESDHLASNAREQGAEGPGIAPGNSTDSHYTELKSSFDQNDIITDRQKIKETDEYKQAMEEEWASRQQQLQRQAEEARRLRNRKRAENMRIMDNERRQKLRLEEIRETRRKDEENLNQKDKLRAEIRNELRKLETMCLDMASLLRALGIHVEGGFHPSSNELQAAYKRACLRFHPDRLSTTDLRQQVEAEEKFKLISNMKDKFSF